MDVPPVRPRLSVPGVHGTDRGSLTRADLVAPWHVVVLALGVIALFAMESLDLRLLSALWPLTGAAVAVSVVTRVRWAILLVLVVGLSAAPFTGVAAATAGVVATAPAIALAAAALRRGSRWLCVDDVPTLLNVIVVAALAAPILSGLVGTLAGVPFGVPFTVGDWAEWAAADSMACLLIPVPMLIWWSVTDEPQHVRPGLNLLLAVVAGALVVLGATASVVIGGVPMGYLVLLPIVWIAMRWHNRGVVLAVYLATAVIAGISAAGYGVLSSARGSIGSELARMWLLLALLLLAGVLVGVVSLQRDLATRALAAENLELTRETEERSRMLSTLLGNLPGVAYRCRADDAYTTEFVSDGAAELYGLDPDVVARGVVSLAGPIHPDDLPAVYRDVDAAARERRPYLLEYRIRRPDGEVRHVWEQGRAVAETDEGVPILEGFIYDVTERVMSERLLLDEARVLDAAMASERSGDVLSALADTARRHVVDHRVAVVGIDETGIVTSVLGDPDAGADWCPELGGRVAVGGAWTRALSGATASSGDGSATTVVVPVTVSDGTVAALVALRAAVAPPPAAVASVEHLAKVAGAALSHVQAQERLRREALYDSLTGLPNRRALGDRVDALLRSSPTPHVGLLFLDVSGFRMVNETYGHALGDSILAGLATRTAATLPTDSDLFRFAGDQFVIVTPDDDPESMTRLARLVQRVASGPYRIGQQALHLTVTIGVAVSRPGSASAGDLVGEAASACDAARRTARDGVRVYDVGLREQSRQLLQTESGLRRALGTDEIETWYQPEYDLTTGVIIGAEALVRWRMPDGRLIPPDQFIPVAEAAGLMGPLGLRVLAEACTQAAVWPEQEPALMVSVNVATAQLLDPVFPESVSDVLGYSGLPPQQLCLEITESALVEADVALTALTRLRALGVLLAIDDFGTGYSSLSRLKGFPVDFLKVDRSFVSGVGVDSDDTAIVDAIVALARTLHLRTVAEGVETAHQATELRARGVTFGQGYLWARPMPAGDLTALLGSPSHGALRRPVRPTSGS